MPPARIPPEAEGRVRVLAMRPCGVIIPEVAEEFDVSDDAARSFVLRLVREQKLFRTGRRRRRTELMPWARGAGGIIYFGTRDRQQRRGRTPAWSGWRQSQARPGPLPRIR